MSSDDGSPARDGGRIEPAVLGREEFVDATAKDAAVEGRERAAAKEDAAGLENMVCQVMPSEQSLQVDDERQRQKGQECVGEEIGGARFHTCPPRTSGRKRLLGEVSDAKSENNGKGFKRKPCAASDSEPGCTFGAPLTAVNAAAEGQQYAQLTCGLLSRCLTRCRCDFWLELRSETQKPTVENGDVVETLIESQQ